LALGGGGLLVASLAQFVGLTLQLATLGIQLKETWNIDFNVFVGSILSHRLRIIANILNV
jgi:hypothetical protein